MLLTNRIICGCYVSLLSDKNNISSHLCQTVWSSVSCIVSLDIRSSTALLYTPTEGPQIHNLIVGGHGNPISLKINHINLALSLPVNNNNKD